MSDKTGIQWTNATWNPVIGCRRVSEGCRNCYAEGQAARIVRMSEARGAETPYVDVVRFAHDDEGHRMKPLPLWNGKAVAMPDRLDQPLRWTKPRLIFVNSMSDLFHEDVPFEFIAAVFGVMAATPRHTFQCLTKRPARMREFLTHPEVRHWVAQARDAALVDAAHDDRERWATIEGYPRHEVSSHGSLRADGRRLATTYNPNTGREQVTLWGPDGGKTLHVHRLVLLAFVPQPTPDHEVCHRNGDKRDNRLANLRWGTRSENQQEKVRHGRRGGPSKLDAHQAEEIRQARAGGETQQRIADRYGISRSLVSLIESGRVWGPPDDLAWPLPNVWLGTSVENQATADERIPHLLECPAAVRWISAEPLLGPVDLACTMFNGADSFGQMPGLGWVVVGGESGPGARVCDVAWIRSIVEQCRAAEVPVFVKQFGARAVDSTWKSGVYAPEDIRAHGAALELGMATAPNLVLTRDRKGGDPDEWAEDLRVREWPEVTP